MLRRSKTVPSVLETKCPSCGVENGPCIVENGIPKFHIARQRLAYPTSYEHPECAECKKLKDEMVYARDSVRTFQPPDPRKSRSRWPRAYQDEMYRLELSANESKAEFELHLFQAHGDKQYESSALRNLEIVLREGRLKP
jgi:hypothetical protein